MNNKPSRNQPRKRDYPAEYRRRIARGMSKGLSRQEARGHGVRPASTLATKDFDPRDRILERGLRLVKGGKSAAAAARELHIAPERLTGYIRRSGVSFKERGRWRIGEDTRSRRMFLYAGGRQIKVWVDFENASLTGKYLSAVGLFLTSNDLRHLAPWVDVRVTDLKGRKHRFETRPNVLYRLTDAGRDDMINIYRISH